MKGVVGEGSPIVKPPFYNRNFEGFEGKVLTNLPRFVLVTPPADVPRQFPLDQFIKASFSLKMADVG